MPGFLKIKEAVMASKPCFFKNLSVVLTYYCIKNSPLSKICTNKGQQWCRPENLKIYVTTVFLDNIPRFLRSVKCTLVSRTPAYNLS